MPDVDGLGIDLGRAETLVAHALDVRPTGTLLPWSVAAELLDIFGITVAPAVAVTTVEACGRRGEPARVSDRAQSHGDAAARTVGGRGCRARPPR